MPEQTPDTQLENPQGPRVQGIQTRIRAFEERDYPAVTALFNAVYSDYPFSEKGTSCTKLGFARQPAWITFEKRLPVISGD